MSALKPEIVFVFPLAFTSSMTSLLARFESGVKHCSILKSGVEAVTLTSHLGLSSRELSTEVNVLRKAMHLAASADPMLDDSLMYAWPPRK